MVLNQCVNKTFLQFVKNIWKGVKVMTKIAATIDKFFKALLPTVDWKEVSMSTYVRYALMLISSLNSILTAFGLNPIPASDDEVYVVISTIFTVLIFIVNTYKDNPTSSESIFSKSVQDELKSMDDTQKEALKNAILAAIYTVKDGTSVTETTPDTSSTNDESTEDKDNKCE